MLPAMETHEQKTPVRDVLLRLIAVIGLIAVLLLGAWGIIQLAVAIPSIFSTGGFSNLFNKGPQKEAVVVSEAANISSGQTLQISWNHQNKADGNYSYSLSYACQSGLSLKAPLPTGTYQSVACNTPFNFVNATSKITVIPTATGKALPLAVTVSATNLLSGAVTAQGSATTNVAPAGAAAATGSKTPTAPKSSTAYTAAPAPAALYGAGDLAVTINSVAPSANGLTTVVFTIQNVGTNVVQSGWSFNANLPINGGYTYASQTQRALNPGDKIAYTLSFSGGSYGYNNGYTNYPYGYTGPSYYTCTGYAPCFGPSHDPVDNPNVYQYGYGYSNGYPAGPITITADPQNLIWESNENNNTAYAN